MSKDLGNTLLFDIYSPLLTEKQRETLDLYYNDDLSLGEISEISGITRQGVMNCIKKAQARLEELEEQFRLAETFTLLSKNVYELSELLSGEELKKKDDIFSKLDTIKKLL